MFCDHDNLKIHKFRQIGHKTGGGIGLILLPRRGDALPYLGQGFADDQIQFGHGRNDHGSPGNCTTTGTLNRITQPMSSFSDWVRVLLLLEFWFELEFWLELEFSVVLELEF